jgi:hypothetical protein
MVYRHDVFGFRKEIAELLERGSTILQRDAHQTGNNVVEPDQFGRAVGSFEAQKDFRGVFVVVDADVLRALSSDAEFLSNVRVASGEGTAHWRVAYIGYAFCNSL